MKAHPQSEAESAAPFYPERALRLHVLASGSKGNAAIVENTATGQGILVDCGICKRDFFARCSQATFDPANLQAILITHDHGDHTKGLGVVCRELARRSVRPKLFVSTAVRAASKPVAEVLDQGLCEFVALAPNTFDIGDIRIIPFATSHDAAESFGFRFEVPGDAIGYITDTGIVPPTARELLRDVRILALESNHDARMLAEGPYPWPIKQRIASEHGHLSNDQASDELAELLGPRLQTVVAMHISQNNNTYRAPEQALREVVTRASHPAAVLVAYQDRLVTVR